MHEVLTKSARSNDVGILREFMGEYRGEHEPSYLINRGTTELIKKYIEQIEKQMRMSYNKFMFFNEKVLTIDNKSDTCVVTTQCSRNNQVNVYRCRKVINSVPLAVSRSITFTNISRAKRFIIDNQLRTNCVKSFLIVREPFWRKHASGDCLFSNDHLVNMCHDISPHDVSCGILVFFHSGKKYDLWESKFKLAPNE